MFRCAALAQYYKVVKYYVIEIKRVLAAARTTTHYDPAIMNTFGPHRIFGVQNGVFAGTFLRE